MGSDAIAYGAIELIAQNLPALMNDLKNIDLRLNVMTASHMAGHSFCIAGLGICHALGHPLSAVFHQAHGQTLATMMPHIMEYNLPLRAEKYAEVAKCFRVHDPSKSVEANARACIEAIGQFSIQVGTARSITEMGGSESDLADLVAQATLDLCNL